MRIQTALILLLFAATLAGADEIRVGVFVHAPNVFAHADTGVPYGPTVDYIRAVIAEMGHQANITVMPLSRVIKGLETGEIDCALDLSRTPEREKFLFFPDMPSLVFKPSLTVLAGSKLSRVVSANDLEGLRIGYLAGASPGPFFENAKNIRYELISGDTWVRQILGMLIAGRVDAALDQNAYSYLAEAKRQGLENRIRVIELPGGGTGFYVTFSKKSPNAPLWLTQYNALNTKEIYNETRLVSEFAEKKQQSGSEKK
jgi:polar amino acid transport system substrate-binding protein